MTIPGILRGQHAEQKYAAEQHTWTDGERQAVAAAKEITVISELKQWFSKWRDDWERDVGASEEATILECAWAMCKVKSCSNCNHVQTLHRVQLL